jgi:hypothetical protein
MLNCKEYLLKLKSLKEIKYNNNIINYNSIKVFDNYNEKKLNDINNKIRENVIGAIINKKITEDYYLLSNRWKFIKNNIINYLKLFDIKEKDNIELIHKGGRNNNYDFLIKSNEKEYKVEFKFNVNKINDSPQFVSPMHPSNFLSNNYEEYYYNNYLKKLSKKYNLDLPPLELYQKEINSCSPKCMKEYQDLYYKGCKSSSKFTNDKTHIDFYNNCKKFDNESRINFITNNEIKLNILSEYLLKTQYDKIYMLCKNGYFYKQELNKENYILIKYEKIPKKYKFVCYSKSGIKINVLLRWKNGNGIAFPSFQIS